MGLLDIVFPGKTKMEVAANIINASYNLEHLPPEINKNAFQDIIDKLQHGFNQDTPEDAYLMFLGEPRKIQLNILSLAYSNINIAPLLKGEYWRYLKNPFLPTIYDETIFNAVMSRMKKQYGISIYIPDEPISSDELFNIFQLDAEAKNGWTSENEADYQEYKKYTMKEEMADFQECQDDSLEEECIEDTEIFELVDAIWEGDSQVVSTLLNKNPSLVSCQNDEGWTPLHLVASQGTDTVKDHSSITSLLISQGADVNATDNLGLTPLHYIAINGSRESLDVAKILLNNNANPNMKNKSGSTPMMMWQHGNEIKELFIKYGATRQY